MSSFRPLTQIELDKAARSLCIWQHDDPDRMVHYEEPGSGWCQLVPHWHLYRIRVVEWLQVQYAVAYAQGVNTMPFEGSAVIFPEKR